MIKPILIVHQTTQDKTHIVVKWVTYFVMSFDTKYKLKHQPLNNNFMVNMINHIVLWTRNRSDLLPEI